MKPHRGPVLREHYDRILLPFDMYQSGLALEHANKVMQLLYWLPIKTRSSLVSERTSKRQPDEKQSSRSVGSVETPKPHELRYGQSGWGRDGTEHVGPRSWREAGTRRSMESLFLLPSKVDFMASPFRKRRAIPARHLALIR